MSSSLMARAMENNTVAFVSKPSDSAPRNALHPPLTSEGARLHQKSKPIIQLLLQENSHMGVLKVPPPFFMCSEEEALDRQSCLELSPFEYKQSSQSDFRNSSNVPLRANADAIWDINEISLDFSPTPKKSSLATAALSTPPTTSYYSKHSSKKRNENNDQTLNSQSITANNITNKNLATPINTAAKTASRIRLTFHPQLVIKKYRRSAAGGGVNEFQGAVRSIDQLNETVNYLMALFARQLPPDLSADGNGVWEIDELGTSLQLFSLLDTVNFIDDRLRAVQKDLVSLVGNLEDESCGACNTISNTQTKNVLRQMQARIVRYNILVLYLLSDVPSDKYQVKFGSVALRTAFTSYLNLSRTIHEEYSNYNSIAFQKELMTQDEIMAYVAIFHMSAVLRSEETTLPPPSFSSASSMLMEDSGSGWGALFSTFTKYASSFESRSLLNMYPRWKWSVDLASSMQCGNHQKYFSLMERGPVNTHDQLKQSQDEIISSDNARFLILARCCCSSSLNLIRLSALRRYNHSFGKAEKVPAENLACLLRFGYANDTKKELASSLKRASEFCRHVGLPILDDDSYNPYVVMKAAPIHISGDKSIDIICRPGRSNDLFVFGSEFKDDMTLLENRLDVVTMDDSIDNWEERDSNAIPVHDEPCNYTKGRIDSDLVAIPPSNVLVKLIG